MCPHCPGMEYLDDNTYDSPHSNSDQCNSHYVGLRITGQPGSILSCFFPPFSKANARLITLRTAIMVPLSTLKNV
jgi:hypothetical protein